MKLARLLLLLPCLLVACGGSDESPETEGQTPATSAAQDSSAPDGARLTAETSTKPIGESLQSVQGGSRSRVQFEFLDLDLGVIYQENTTEIRFPFVVEGPDPVTITGMDASCGCSEVSLEVEGKPYPINTPIKAGAKGAVVGTFNAAQYLNTKTSTIRVMGNAMNLPITLNNIDVQDSDGRGSTNGILRATNSVDSGNNLDWFFGNAQITGRLGTGGGNALLYIEGTQVAQTPIDGAGNFLFDNVQLQAGRRIAVIKDVDNGSATFTVAGGNGNVNLPDNAVDDTFSLVLTTETANGAFSNADLFAGFANVPTLRHPFFAASTPTLDLEAGYRVTVTGGPLGAASWQPSGNINLTGTGARLDITARGASPARLVLGNGTSLGSQGTAGSSSVGELCELTLEAGSSASLMGDMTVTGLLSVGPGVTLAARDLTTLGATGSRLVSLAANASGPSDGRARARGLW